MRQSLTGILWRLAIFILVCGMGIAGMFAVFGQLRFQQEKTYNAVFANVSGLKDGNFVRIAGVEVGKVDEITVNDDATVTVKFSADDSVTVTRGHRGGGPLRKSPRRPVHGSRGRRRISEAAATRTDDSGRTNQARPGFGDPDRRVPPIAARTGRRPGQCADRPTRPGIPGPGDHHQLVSGSNGLGDQHIGRPRPAHRPGDRQPQHGAGITG